MQTDMTRGPHSQPRTTLPSQHTSPTPIPSLIPQIARMSDKGETTNYLKMLLPKLKPNKLIPSLLARRLNLPRRRTRPTKIHPNLRLNLVNV